MSDHMFCKRQGLERKFLGGYYNSVIKQPELPLVVLYSEKQLEISSREHY